MDIEQLKAFEYIVREGTFSRAARPLGIAQPTITARIHLLEQELGGEHLHSLARDIAFGRQGRFHDRGYEAQLNRASALSVVINAIAVWNTRYFERAQEALARQGVPVPEQIWQHLSTLQWAHIHLNGSYHFTDVTLKGDFRPLREYQGPRTPQTDQSSVPGSADGTPIPEKDETLDPTQLSLFLEEEQDL